MRRSSLRSLTGGASEPPRSGREAAQGKGGRIRHPDPDPVRRGKDARPDRDVPQGEGVEGEGRRPGRDGDERRGGDPLGADRAAVDGEGIRSGREGHTRQEGIAGAPRAEPAGPHPDGRGPAIRDEGGRYPGGGEHPRRPDHGVHAGVDRDGRRAGAGLSRRDPAFEHHRALRRIGGAALPATAEGLGTDGEDLHPRPGRRDPQGHPEAPLQPCRRAGGEADRGPVHRLRREGGGKDANTPYIGPGDIDLTDQEIRQELVKYIGSEYNEVSESR